MKKTIILYILAMNFLIATNWIKHPEGNISSSSLVLMFTDEASPKTGYEKPIQLSNFPMLENIVFKYGRANLDPVFSNYNQFEEKHYSFHLHQYYKLEFDSSKDILGLIQELNNLPMIEKVEFNYIKEINVTPNDP